MIFNCFTSKIMTKCLLFIMDKFYQHITPTELSLCNLLTINITSALI